MITIQEMRELNNRYKSQSEPVLPAILTFKRKAIRVLPDGKQIASYYSDQTRTTIIYPNTFIEKEHP